jgi:hypothetical protein
VAVHDQRAEVGRPTPASRGLRIVDTLSADWGVTPTATGKYFWADVAAPH